MCKLNVLGKYNFSDTIKLQILRSDYPALSEWSPIPKTNVLIKKKGGASLMAQWIRICLPRQETWV